MLGGEGRAVGLEGDPRPSTEQLGAWQQFADFVEASIGNLQGKLAIAAVVVAVVVLLFLGDARMTLISLSAIPLSVLTAILVFRALDVSINTMTLGGLAIAIGELVDDGRPDGRLAVRILSAGQA